MSFDNAWVLGVLVLISVTLIPAVDTVLGWIRGGQRRRVQVDEEYALKSHEHADYLTRGEWREACIRQHAEESTRLNRIESKLDSVPMVVSDSFKELETKAEARASKLHERIGPIAEKTVSIRDALDRHLDDHRAGKA